MWIRPTLLFILVCFCFNVTQSAKILSIFSVPSPSHYIFGSALLKELAKRGHEITSVNVYPQKTPIKNFRDIFVENNNGISSEFMKTAQESLKSNVWRDMNQINEITFNMCKNIFVHPEFEELLKSPKNKFDLIIVQATWSDSLNGLGEHFNAPMIGVSTFGTLMGIDDIVGNSSPSSVIPNLFLSLTTKMTFSERVQNFIGNIETYIWVNYFIFYRQKALYEKYFPNAKLSFSEARTNYALLLLNQHHTLSYPRSYVTNAIEVGGLHINKKTDPLPKDLQQFLDNATEGVIYFSMGSNVKSKDFTPEKKDLFFNVFRGLKQKVLWKFEDPELSGKPDNVFIKQWIPQHSVLAHPNVILFITHGGLLSITEAVFFGKPILGIPMFRDQPRNIELAVSRGFSLGVDFADLTEEQFRNTLNELLNNPKYMEKAKTISSHYHDQPLTPMNTAVYWVEYILKHGGAHLRNAGADMNLWQYYSIDVIGILLSIIGISLFIMLRIVRILIGYAKGFLGVSEKKIKSN